MLEIKPCFLTSGLRETGQEADSRGPERILGEKNIIKCKNFPNTPEAPAGGKVENSDNLNTSTKTVT